MHTESLKLGLCLLTDIVAIVILAGAKTYLNRAFGYVSVKDVALAHILAYENPHASGRYIVSQEVVHFEDVVNLLRRLFPEYPVVAQ